jgi:hypothetical protein
MAASVSSNDLTMGTFVCMLGPLNLNRAAMGTPGSGMGQGSMGQGSTGQGSMGQGSTGQGSMGQGSMGQGSTGQGSTGQGTTGQGTTGQGSTGGSSGSSGSAAEACVAIGQATNVMPTALVLGDSSAIDTVRRNLENRLTAEGATPDVSSNTLALFDKGVAAAKEARIADEALYGGTSPRGVGGGPSSGSSHGHGTSGATKPEGSKPSTAARPGADEIKAHRALGDLYQFGRNLGTTETGTQAQALAWIIAVDRFQTVVDLPPQQKSLAAEPLFAVMFNVPGPTGAKASNWADYLSAAARSAGSATGAPPGAVGGGPATANDKANLRQVAHGAEDRLQVLGQQLPPSSPLRPEIDRTISDLRKIEAQTATPSTQGTPPRSTTPKKPPSQSPSQPKQPSQQNPQNQKQQK